MNWKNYFLFSVLLLVLSNMVWMYIVVDQRTGKGYLELNYEAELRAKQSLVHLFLKTKEYSRKDVMELLGKIDAQASDYVELGNDGFMSNGLKFQFQNDRLVEIQ